MPKINPINLVNTNLNISEHHYHSYTISPFRKLFNNYYRSLDYYTIHLTNERLIIEPYINYDILLNFFKIYQFLPIPENLLTILTESRISVAKKCMALIKYKSIYLPYTIISSFDKVQINDRFSIKIVLKELNNNLEIKAFENLEFDTFKVFHVQKIASLKDISNSLQSLFTNDIDQATLDFYFPASSLLNMNNLIHKLQ